MKLSWITRKLRKLVKCPKVRSGDKDDNERNRNDNSDSDGDSIGFT